MCQLRFNIWIFGATSSSKTASKTVQRQRSKILSSAAIGASHNTTDLIFLLSTKVCHTVTTDSDSDCISKSIHKTWLFMHSVTIQVKSGKHGRYSRHTTVTTQAFAILVAVLRTNKCTISNRIQSSIMTRRSQSV